MAVGLATEAEDGVGCRRGRLRGRDSPRKDEGRRDAVEGAALFSVSLGISAIGRHKEKRERPSNLFIEVSYRSGKSKVIERFVIPGGAWGGGQDTNVRDGVQITLRDKNPCTGETMILDDPSGFELVRSDES